MTNLLISVVAVISLYLAIFWMERRTRRLFRASMGIDFFGDLNAARRKFRNDRFACAALTFLLLLALAASVYSLATFPH